MALPNSFSGKGWSNKTNRGGLAPSRQIVRSLFRTPLASEASQKNEFNLMSHYITIDIMIEFRLKKVSKCGNFNLEN